MITETVWLTPVWSCQERFHFLFLQILPGGGRMLFEVNHPNLTAPFQVLRAIKPHKTTPGTQSSQSLVTGGRPAMTDLLKMYHECSYSFCCYPYLRQTV